MTRALTWPTGRRLLDWLRPAAPALLFGLRLWAAVCLALYIAFKLELDDAVWAGTSAAIVCQPSLGASLRKGSARMIGTVVGALVIVLLTAAMPQDRIAYLLALALWCAACGFVATVLKDSASYAAALAGVTTVIIAGDLFGPTGGANSDVFMLAVTRASEICIGIVSAGIVLAGTDLGGARQRLAAQLSALTAQIAAGLAATLSPAPDHAAAHQRRRALIARGAALAPAIEEATGEAHDLRYRARTLMAAVDGLYAAVSGWRTAATCLERLPDEQARREAEAVRRCLPLSLTLAPAQGDATAWAAVPSRLCLDSRRAARSLVALPADTPSLRLMADTTAEALLGLSRTFDGLVLLIEPDRYTPLRHIARTRIADPLPAVISAVRVLVAVVATELFWVATAWPSGGLAVTFVAIGTVLMSPRGEQAYASAKTFLIGIAVTAVVAGAIKFGVLPGTRTFAEFGLGIGLALVPFGFFLALPWHAPVFIGAIVMIMPLVAPANQMTYDTTVFYNTVVSVFAGMAATMVVTVLLPLPAPAVRTARLLRFTLRDVRRLAVAKTLRATDDWEARLYSRLSALPPQAEPLQIAWLATALSVGIEIIRLRRAARRLDLGPDFAAALAAFAAGHGTLTIERLALVDRRLAPATVAKPLVPVALRARGSIQSLCDALTRHAAYFDAEVTA